ncbi:hypothetical protein J6590_026509 [Homalodisca vitripennis]|nr:hypothetical protein J6590_026509 [Homalodisca vitripennis]
MPSYLLDRSGVRRAERKGNGPARLYSILVSLGLVLITIECCRLFVRYRGCHASCYLLPATIKLSFDYHRATILLSTICYHSVYYRTSIKLTLNYYRGYDLPLI